MSKLLIAAACLLLLQVGIRAEEPVADPIAKKITAAKDAYYAERDKAEQALIVLLEKKEALAKQAGDLKALETARAESEAFRKEGTLPKLVPLTIYESSMKTARTKLENVYLGAIKTYTQAEKLENAKAIQKELDEFRSGQKSTEKPDNTADPLQLNSIWADDRGKIVITKRSGEDIQCSVVSTTGEKLINGKFKDRKLTLLAKDAEAVVGKNEVDYEGVLAKDETGYLLNMVWKNNFSGKTSKYVIRLKK